MTTWVYFLICEGNTLYTGIADDPLARLGRHRSGKGARFTRMRKPISLMGALPFETRSEALSKEYQFKQLQRHERLQWAELAARHPAWLEFKRHAQR